MDYSRLQYISSGRTPEEHYQNISLALKQGISWIQVRAKGVSEREISDLIQAVMALKRHFSFTLIVNDHVNLAKEAHVDGVHLGLTDMSISAARAHLGPGKIIGGTANSAADVQQRVKEGCDYIGLGPLRYTATKEELSPILGFEGYRSILETFAQQTIPPIFAIGGIQENDIALLRKIGIYGVALSKHIQDNFQDKRHVEHLNTLLYEHEIENRR